MIINNSIGNSPASSCSSPPAGGLRTPEPPKPLLSQAALPSVLEKKFNFGVRFYIQQECADLVI